MQVQYTKQSKQKLTLLKLLKGHRHVIYTKNVLHSKYELKVCKIYIVNSFGYNIRVIFVTLSSLYVCMVNAITIYVVFPQS